MKTWRKLALIVLVGLMILGILLTWGSMFSILLALGLFSVAGVLMIRRFLPDDRESDFYEDPIG